jgi:hypothetical protein
MKKRKLPTKKKRQDDDGTNEWMMTYGVFLVTAQMTRYGQKSFFFGPPISSSSFFWSVLFFQNLSAFALCTYPLPWEWISTFTDTMVKKPKKQVQFCCFGACKLQPMFVCFFGEDLHKNLPQNFLKGIFPFKFLFLNSRFIEKKFEKISSRFNTVFFFLGGGRFFFN